MYKVLDCSKKSYPNLCVNDVILSNSEGTMHQCVFTLLEQMISSE